MDLSIFLTPEAWISLLTLIFLEIVLGVDNLVFIAITTDRLPLEKQHIGRRLGLAGALLMRILFLCFASFLVHLTAPLFTITLGSFSHGISIRDLVMIVGGAYLLYKGIVELLDMLHLTELKAAHGSEEHKKLHMLSLPQAIATIMVMDLVFSIDSVITAVGLADHLIIMIIAVMVAVLIMMVFIDPISNFINRHPEMKILALCFISVIGVLLILDGLGIHSGVEVLGMAGEKLMVYFSMVFAFILELIQMRYTRNYTLWRRDMWKDETAAQVERVRREMMAETGRSADEKIAKAASESEQTGKTTPIIIGNNVYVMIPMEDQDAESFKTMISEDGEHKQVFTKPIEIDADAVEVIEPEEGQDGSDGPAAEGPAAEDPSSENE